VKYEDLEQEASWEEMKDTQSYSYSNQQGADIHVCMPSVDYPKTFTLRMHGIRYVHGISSFYFLYHHLLLATIVEIGQPVNLISWSSHNSS